MRYLAFFALMGCGLSEGTLLVDMDEADWEKACAELEAEEPVEATCDVAGTPFEVTVGGTEAECVADSNGTWTANCEATYGDALECREALRADPCLLLSEQAPAACVAVFDCVVVEG